MCVAIIGDEMAPAVLLVTDNGVLGTKPLINLEARYTHECMYLY